MMRGAYMHDPMATDENPTTEGPLQYGLPYQSQWLPDPETYPEIRVGDAFMIQDPTYPDQQRRVRVEYRYTFSEFAWLSCFDPGYTGWMHHMRLEHLATARRLTKREEHRTFNR